MSTVFTQVQGPNLPLDSLHKIDEQIAQLEAQIIQLKLLRNTFVPIAGLHPEVLQEIFFLTHISSPQHSKSKSSLLITWVSHAWRELAQVTPNLWAYIDSNHPRWVEATLPRTKGHVLMIDLDLQVTSQSRMQEWDAVTRLCLKNLWRIKTLGIRWRNLIFPDALSEWETPAPALVELHLWGTALPPDIFSGICPSLRTLRLVSCEAKWTTLPGLANLEELAIACPRSRVPIDDMAKIMHSTGHSLERLTLYNCLLPPSVDDHGGVSDRVPLDNLTTLTVHDRDLGAIETLLDLIALPSLANTVIGVLEWENTMARALLSSRDILRWEIDRLEIKNGEEATVLINAIEVQRNMTQHTKNDGNSLCRIAEPHRSIATDPLLIQGINTAFYIKDTRKLDWLEYFGGLGTVRKLCLHPAFLPSFLRFLKAHANISETGTGDGISQKDRVSASFSNLRVLEICGEVEDGFSLDREGALALHKWLVQLCKLALRLNRLVISGMTVPSGTWLYDLFDQLADNFELADVEETDDVDDETSKFPG
ncbi:hypothetical protein BDN72DRAFT_905454 [Pluteus cervinus]|uniref:Uncharacterized protein n=1 Tax=Pluteus cervinus TaxID=181527 RepID=A0ACD3A2E8_9AGAR|nr:hypothetical protein BDN72DRAFT_905454 [Pluteus cervinus]